MVFRVLFWFSWTLWLLTYLCCGFDSLSFILFYIYVAFIEEIQDVMFVLFSNLFIYVCDFHLQVHCVIVRFIIYIVSQQFIRFFAAYFKLLNLVVIKRLICVSYTGLNPTVNEFTEYLSDSPFWMIISFCPLLTVRLVVVLTNLSKFIPFTASWIVKSLHGFVSVLI